MEIHVESAIRIFQALTIYKAYGMCLILFWDRHTILGFIDRFPKCLNGDLMALIKCKDCERDVSTLAANCPNCGRPVDEQQLPLPHPCPDGDCTGTLDEDGACGTCGKHKTWKDFNKKTSVSLATDPETPATTKPEKPDSPKSALIALVTMIGIMIGCILLAFFFAGDKNPDNSKPSTAVPPAEQGASIAIDQTAHEKAECTASVESMKAEYGKLMSEKKYWDAGHQTNLIEQCAKTLQDKSLEAWANDASVQSYVQAIKDPKTPIIEKMNLIELFKQFHPDKAQPYVSMLSDLNRKQDAIEQREQIIEQRKMAAQKKREGVRIGMTPEDVRASSWGKPEHINRTTATYGTHEQWVYGSGSCLYFEDGILTTIQN